MNHLDLVPMTSPFLCFYLTAGTKPENPSSENFCNPEIYSYSFSGMLVGEKSIDKTKDYKYWKEFWNEYKNSLTWDNKKGHFVAY